VKPLTVGTIIGEKVLLPPGHVRVTLNREHRRAYLHLYGQSFPLTDVPALSDHDFDGRSIKMSRPQLEALNRRFRALADAADPAPRDAFRDQERSVTRNFKAMQFLS